jgi:hypothetical protein
MQLSYEFIQRLCDREGWYWCDEYGEPGYSTNGNDTPAVVLGDYWLRGKRLRKANQHLGKTSDALQSFMSAYPRVFDQLDTQGVSFEWHDEWTDINNLAYRTQPDSYGWQPSWYHADGELCTLDDGIGCLMECHKNDPTTAVNLRGLDSAMLEAEGWVQINGTFENGWFPGQNDDPKKITDHYRKEYPDHDFVFVIGGVGQFDIAFNLFAKPLDSGE